MLMLFIGLKPAMGEAAPIRGTGSAKTSEWKKGGTTERARARAIRRARLDALAAALTKVPGAKDPASVKAVSKAGEAWTGAYRVVNERVVAGSVSVELDVEIDLARLGKRVSPQVLGTAKGARYQLGALEVQPACEDAAASLEDDLVALGAVSRTGKATPVDVSVQCRPLGPVPHTLLHATSVVVVAKSGERVVAQQTRPGFGLDPTTARARALLEALDDVAATLRQHRDDQIIVRIESPLPADRIRRLQRAMVDRISGVRKASLHGIDPDGAVRLRVEGSMDARKLGRRLQALNESEISITIVGVDGKDALTIRLH